MDVAAWLRGLGLERYEQAFRDNEIDWKALPKLTAEDLKDLGVTSVGHRWRDANAPGEIAPFGGMKEGGIGPIYWFTGARNTASSHFLKVEYLCLGGIDC
jgi:hypothetical protein